MAFVSICVTLVSCAMPPTLSYSSTSRRVAPHGLDAGLTGLGFAMDVGGLLLHWVPQRIKFQVGRNKQKGTLFRRLMALLGPAPNRAMRPSGTTGT